MIAKPPRHSAPAERAFQQLAYNVTTLTTLAVWTVVIVMLMGVPSTAVAQPGTIAEATRENQAADPRLRRALFELLQPVKLKNCEIERFGEPDDGGYLMCANLLGGVKAAYSYGISGYDKWGCDISTKLRVTLHQYDCFDTRQPACPGGDTVFHAECVGDTTKTEDGRVFDTMHNQFAKNGDAHKSLVVKMDVESAEWDSLRHASDETLDQMEQLAIELHFINEERFLKVVQRLKQFFHIVHVHFNNFSCASGLDPFPAWAYEVLFVNKRIGVVDPTERPPGVHPLAAPNSPNLPDCQLKTP